jgi:hypothetical protein
MGGGSVGFNRLEIDKRIAPDGLGKGAAGVLSVEG